MTLDRLAELLSAVRDSPWLVGVLLLAFLVAGLLFLSVWFVILQTGLLLPPPLSFSVALAGALLSAMTFFILGRLGFGRFLMRRASVRVVRAIQGARFEHIVALRLVPVLPYTLVNVAAGALGVPLRTFFWGTLLGMTPGIVAVTLLGERALAVVQDPSPQSILLLVAVGALLVGSGRWLRRRTAGLADRPRAGGQTTEAP